VRFAWSVGGGVGVLVVVTELTIREKCLWLYMRWLKRPSRSRPDGVCGTWVSRLLFCSFGVRC